MDVHLQPPTSIGDDLDGADGAATPRSFGAYADAELSGADSEDWLRANGFAESVGGPDATLDAPSPRRPTLKGSG